MKNSAIVWVSLVFSIISTLLSIAVVAYLAGTFYLEQKQSNEPTKNVVTETVPDATNQETSEEIVIAEPTEEPVTETEQYCDEQFGFSFEYPTELVSGPTDKNDFTDSLALTFEGKKDIEQVGVFVDFGTGFENYEPFDTETVEVAGDSAKWTKSADSDDESYLALVSWDHAGKQYALAVFFDHEYETSDDAIVEDMLDSWSYECVL